jgi:hypothetical protein
MVLLEKGLFKNHEKSKILYFETIATHYPDFSVDAYKTTIITNNGKISADEKSVDFFRIKL